MVFLNRVLGGFDGCANLFDVAFYCYEVTFLVAAVALSSFLPNASVDVLLSTAPSAPFAPFTLFALVAALSNDNFLALVVVAVVVVYYCCVSFACDAFYAFLA